MYLWVYQTTPLISGAKKRIFSAGINMAPIFTINWTQIKHFCRKLKKIGNPIKKSKTENLATLLQLTPIVEFLAMAGKIRSTRENFP
jgi:hypothetical protein